VYGCCCCCSCWTTKGEAVCPAGPEGAAACGATAGFSVDADGPTPS
jgi:hypothetical protein